jgi:hypothetical protein
MFTLSVSCLFLCIVGSSHLKAPATEQGANINFCSFVKHISFRDITSAMGSKADAGLQVTRTFSWWL